MNGLGALQRHQLPHPPCKNPGSATVVFTCSVRRCELRVCTRCWWRWTTATVTVRQQVATVRRRRRRHGTRPPRQSPQRPPRPVAPRSTEPPPSSTTYSTNCSAKPTAVPEPCELSPTSAGGAFRDGSWPKYLGGHGPFPCFTSPSSSVPLPFSFPPLPLPPPSP